MTNVITFIFILNNRGQSKKEILIPEFEENNPSENKRQFS